MKNYWRKSAYGCKYRIKFSPEFTKGVALTFFDRIKLFLGADLIIVHHNSIKKTAQIPARKEAVDIK